MITFQGLRMRTELMMEVMRQDAITEMIKRFQTAATRYYTNGYDNGETVKLIKELEALGVDQDVIFDIEWKIREQCKTV